MMRRFCTLAVCLLGLVMACSGSPSGPADADLADTDSTAVDLGPGADIAPSDVASAGDRGLSGDEGPPEETHSGCVDSDGDGYPVSECGGRAPDCDDANDRVNPGRSEVCDTAGVDEDCNPCTVASATTRDGDADMDGFLSARCTNPFAGTAPTCEAMVVTVDATARRVSGRDCNDDRAMGGADVRPNQVEVCGNMVDDNCDGRVDYVDALYEDRDNDGRGNRAVMMAGTCRPGWVVNDEDCDDARNETYRGAREHCDGVDNDCSLAGAAAGGPDPTEDGDGDRHSLPSAMCLGRNEIGALGSDFPKDDCDDAAATVYTGATEVCGNGVDEDCNRVVDDPTRSVCIDADGDGHGTAATMRTVMSCTLPAGTVTICDDCDDTSAVAARRTPGAREVCDRVDNNCSTPASASAIDEDQDNDGYASSAAECAGRGEDGVLMTAFPKTDCDDTNREVHPGAADVCDRNDHDCSSGGGVALDEDADNDGHAAPTAACRGRGESGAPSTAFPRDDCDETRPTVHGGRSAAEDYAACDGLDNDCNAATSEVTRRDGCSAGGYCAPGGVCGRGAAVLQVVAGDLHTCARQGDGAVRCWGNNRNGQLGDGTLTSRSSPAAVPGLTGVVALAAGWNHTCARLADGTVRCWGENTFGQLGDGTTTLRVVPTAVTGLTGVVELVAAQSHTCARLADGSVRCWGGNGYGQLADGTTTPRRDVRVVPGLTGVVELAAGGDQTCARAVDGSVRCWGGNFQGQLGDGTTTDRSSPTLVAGLTGVVALEAAPLHTCARLADGTARCWGYNQSGQLGHASADTCILEVFFGELIGFMLVPVPCGTRPGAVAGLTDVVALAAGRDHTCARRGDGTVRCWGGNGRGQLGDGTTTARPEPTTVPGLTGVVELAAGREHTCARLDDGTLRCWGQNLFGQLGDGTTTSRPSPTPVPWPTAVFELATGGGHTCARLGDGSVRCWGGNGRGQLGDGTTTNRPGPTTVPGLVGVIELAAGGEYTCARLGDGSLRCWGGNYAGQLGDGTNTARLGPTAVTGLTGVGGLAAGSAHTCVRLNDSTVRCWGDNRYGQLGIGNTVSRWSPTVVPGLTGVVELAAGGLHTCARLGDGSVRCWGRNAAGQLGDGTTTDRLSPTAAAGVSGVGGLAAGNDHTCVWLGDGSVRCWGANAYGQLGDSDGAGFMSMRPDPTAVPGLTDVVELVAGFGRTCARLGDSAVRCWGLDIGTSPTAVMGLTGVVEIAGGGRHNCARHGGGAVRCWGANDSGQLGDGTTTSRPIPTLLLEL